MQKDNRWTGDRVMGVPRLTDACGEYRWATVAQIAENRNVGQDRKVSEHTVHRGLLFMRLCSHRPVRVSMMTLIHRWKGLQLGCEHQNWGRIHRNILKINSKKFLRIPKCSSWQILKKCSNMFLRTSYFFLKKELTVFIWLNTEKRREEKRREEKRREEKRREEKRREEKRREEKRREEKRREEKRREDWLV